MKHYLGIDCGSVSVKGVVIDENKKIIKSYYIKNMGLINTIKDVISNLKVVDKISKVGITGSGKDFISIIIGGDILESEIISHFVATLTLYPNVKTIFDIGGEDSKLIVVNNGNLTTFQMNRDCGGGTGAMIESIANRMNISLEDIGETALKSKIKVLIPSKCGIFAQSAVVSKLNKGVSKEDILMGVCRGLVGNYFTMLAKGIKLAPPFVFQGATAKNKALVKSFEEELHTKIIVPDQPHLMGAYGVALLSLEDKADGTKFKGFDIKDKEFKTETYYGNGCTNKCEISQIFDGDELMGHIGNRCDKCV